MENLIKDNSCYSTSLIIKYAHKRGIPAEQLFEGIEGYRGLLENPLAWIDSLIMIELLRNIKRSLSNKPGILYDMGREIMYNQIKHFALLFFRIAPLSIIAKNIKQHYHKSISKSQDVTLAYSKDGELNIYFQPLDLSRYVEEMCEFNRGCIFATAELRGYTNITLTEISCAAHDSSATSCHYKVTWTPKPNLIRKIKDLLLFRFKHQNAIIQHLEENHKTLQGQYNEISQLYDKLVKSEVKFRTIFENIQDVYFEISPDGTILEMSPSINSISLYQREQLLNSPFNDICIHKDALTRIIHELETVKRISDHELSIKNKNNETIFCTLTARFINEKGQKKITGVLRDSTERKKAEQEKQQLQERLRQSEKLSAIGQLAGGIAHDFKNQLFGIRANARFIKAESSNDPQIRKYAINILKSSQRSTDLTKQLLAFARKGKYQSVGIDMHALILDISDLLQHTLDRKITIKTLLEAEKNIIQGDPGQIENALLNLTFNARDAMPKGGTLTFSLRNRQVNEEFGKKSEYEITPGLYVQIAITDTGKGIDENNLKSLFEPFYTTKKWGNGLGLSAVYGTIKEHNGAINIETQKGTGTTVYIYLPCSSQIPVQKQDKEDMKILTEMKTLLLVEDEETVRNSAKEALEASKFNVVAFANGSSALDYYKDNYTGIDLILLDMMLPDIEVHDLFLSLRKINPEAKIILWSAFTQPKTVSALKAKGAIDFIDKSGDIEEFTRRISEIAESLSASDGDFNCLH